MVPSFCPSFPHQGQWVTPLKWWSALGWWMLVKPMTFSDFEGDTGQKISNLLAGSLECSWHVAVWSAQSKFPGFHRFQNWVGQQIQSCSKRHQPCHMKFCCWSSGSCPGSNPLLPHILIWSPCWRLPGSFLIMPYREAFPPIALNEGTRWELP